MADLSCVSLTILRQVEFALVIDDGQTQLTQPPDTTQQVARQSLVFCEVDDALKSDVEGLDRYLVTIGLKRPGERSHPFGNACVYVKPEFEADLVAEDAKFCSGVYIGISMNDFVPQDETCRNADTIGLI